MSIDAVRSQPTPPAAPPAPAPAPAAPPAAPQPPPATSSPQAPSAYHSDSFEPAQALNAKSGGGALSASDNPTLQSGSSGADVERLQQTLAARGHDPGGADGIFGPKTDAAVRSFQSASGLEADGIVGPKTWAALGGQPAQSPAEAERAMWAQIDMASLTPLGAVPPAPPAAPAPAAPAPAPSAPSVANKPTLQSGSSGADVQQLQQTLAARGHDPGGADGLFGPKTDAAVRSFQSASGLEADGIVGPKTWSALGAQPAPSAAEAERAMWAQIDMASLTPLGALPPSSASSAPRPAPSGPQKVESDYAAEDAKRGMWAQIDMASLTPLGALPPAPPVSPAAPAPAANPDPEGLLPLGAVAPKPDVSTVNLQHLSAGVGLAKDGAYVAGQGMKDWGTYTAELGRTPGFDKLPSTVLSVTSEDWARHGSEIQKTLQAEGAWTDMELSSRFWTAEGNLDRYAGRDLVAFAGEDGIPKDSFVLREMEVAKSIRFIGPGAEKAQAELANSAFSEIERARTGAPLSETGRFARVGAALSGADAVLSIWGAAQNPTDPRNAAQAASSTAQAVEAVAQLRGATNVARTAGRFATVANAAIAGLDAARAIDTLRDPNESAGHKVGDTVTALGSGVAALPIPIVSQAGAAVATLSDLVTHGNDDMGIQRQELADFGLSPTAMAELSISHPGVFADPNQVHALVHAAQSVGVGAAGLPGFADRLARENPAFGEDLRTHLIEGGAGDMIDRRPEAAAERARQYLEQSFPGTYTAALAQPSALPSAAQRKAVQDVESAALDSGLGAADTLASNVKEHAGDPEYLAALATQVRKLYGDEMIDELTFRVGLLSSSAQRAFRSAAS